MVVGAMASNRARTLSFFFKCESFSSGSQNRVFAGDDVRSLAGSRTPHVVPYHLFRPFEFAGEEIIHDEGGDVGGDLEVEGGDIGGTDVEVELVATFDEPAKEFVNRILFFVGPFANGVAEFAAAFAEIGGSLHAIIDFGAGVEEAFQVLIVEVGIDVFVEFSFFRVVSFEFYVEAIVVLDAVCGLVDGRFAGDGAHEFIDIFEFLERFPAAITLAPIEAGSEPDGESFGEVFVGMRLGIPVVKMDDVGTAIGTGAVKFGSVVGRSFAEDLLPLFFPGELVGVGVGVGGFVADELHEPVGGAPFDFENELEFELTEAFVDEVKGNENRGNADGDEPFVADVAGWMEGEILGAEFGVELLDEWLEFGAFDLEAELRNLALEQFVVAEIHPIGGVHDAATLQGEEDVHQNVRWPRSDHTRGPARRERRFGSENLQTLWLRAVQERPTWNAAAPSASRH